MNSVVNRRAFVGTVAAGLPLLATGGGVTAAQRGTGRTTRTGADAVERELVKQIRENVRGMQGPRRGEAARRLAASLRLAAANFTVKGVDAQVNTILRETLKRDGEEAFLLREIDPAMLASELKDFGIARLPTTAPDYAARRQAIGVVLSAGVTSRILAVADNFEALSRDLDNYPIVPIRRAAGCPDLRIQLAAIEVIMIAACLANAITCAVFSGMYAGLMLALAFYGC